MKMSEALQRMSERHIAELEKVTGRKVKSIRYNFDEENAIEPEKNHEDKATES